MKYAITINKFDSGLNEVLNGVRYDWKQKRVVNWAKAKNDKVCIDSIRFSNLYKANIKTPIVIHYKFYAKDKRRDRMNIASAFDKSFEDALQKVVKTNGKKLLDNDGWNEVVGVTFDFAIDNKNPRVDVCIEEVKKEPKGWEGWEDVNKARGIKD